MPRKPTGNPRGRRPRTEGGVIADHSFRVKLTAAEHEILTAAAFVNGWPSVAEYVRALCLTGQTTLVLARAAAMKAGTRDGEAEVDTVCVEQGLSVIAETLKPGHLGWDEGAMNARAHRLAGVPDAYADTYYRAYAKAARARAEALTAPRPRSRAHR